MKKIGCAILSIVFLLMAFASTIFPMQKTKVQAKAFGVEEQYINQDTIDLISANPTGILNATIEQNCTPFDLETKQRMPGAAITPNADRYGQIANVSFGVTNFTATQNDSIFMWIYLIDAVTFELTISVNDGGSNNLEWYFNSSKIYEMGTGWRLFELKFDDFNKELLEGINYQIITIKYISDIEVWEESGKTAGYDIETNERLSIYHVFLSKSANLSQNSGIIYKLSNIYYEFCENFDMVNSVSLGDKIKFDSPSSIFSSLYVGKYDLSNYSVLGKYFWIITYTDPNSVNHTIEFGDTIKFVMQGFYNVQIRLYENMLLKDEPILNVGFNIFCEELALGSFVMGSSYNVNKDELLLISFRISNDIVLSNDIEITLSNNNAEIDSYYQKDGVVYVYVLAKNSGTTNLKLNANATSKLGTKVDSYSASASIKIHADSNGGVSIVILWIVFGAFCLGIIIYFVISLVKSRRIDVK